MAESLQASRSVLAANPLGKGYMLEFYFRFEFFEFEV
ncbi:hypothetical protein SLEP1_g24098 [Rubroshorea leprosula]|uniref:Uncharacterized protein n=1 Tax=Rubroshorea leprosula TaxID=152421 RepID=A0AAV5JKR5_9ROSI|nr:hypothetical protein SLEP1_g24098 [Rubroshorea leprosula]